jgi:Na+-driven multidrug efflux pump
MLLPLIWELDGIWISIVVAEFMACTISLLLIAICKKKYKY